MDFRHSTLIGSYLCFLLSEYNEYDDLVKIDNVLNDLLVCSVFVKNIFREKETSLAEIECK